MNATGLHMATQTTPAMRLNGCCMRSYDGARLAAPRLHPSRNRVASTTHKNAVFHFLVVMCLPFLRKASHAAMLPELSLEAVVQEVAETIPQLPVIPPDPVLILQPKAQKPIRAAAKPASSGPAPDQAPPEDPATARQNPLEDPPAVGGVQEAQPRRVSGVAEGGATSGQESQAEPPQPPAQQEAAASGTQACTVVSGA